MQKFYRILLWVGVVVSTVVLVRYLGDWGLNTDAVQRWVEETSTKHLGYKVTYQALNFSLLPLGVEMAEVRVSGNDDQKFSSPKISADISGWSLFEGKPKIGTLHITSPKVAWKKTYTSEEEEDEEQPARWPRITNEYLERLLVTNPEVKLDVQASDLRWHKLEVGGGGLAIDFAAVRGELEAELELKHLAYRHGDEDRIRDGQVVGYLTLGKDEFVIEIENLVSKNLAGGLRGTLRGQATIGEDRVIADTVQVQGEGDLVGDLALLDALLGISETEGEAKADFKIEMRFPLRGRTTFMAQGLAKATNGTLGGIKIFYSEAFLTVTQDGMTFADGKLILENEQRGVYRGEIDFRDDIMFDFSGTVERLKLTEVLGAFNVDFTPFDFDIATHEVRVFGKGRPLDLQIKADTSLSAIEVYKLKNYRASPVCKMSIDLHSNDEQFTFREITGSCALPDGKQTDINMTGTISYKSGEVDIDAVSENFYLRTAGFLLPEKVRGVAKAKINIGGAGDAIVVASDVVARGLRFGDKKIGDASLVARFHREHMAWDKMRVVLSNKGVIEAKRGNLTYDRLKFATAISAQGVSSADMSWLLVNRYELPIAFGVDTLQGEVRGYVLQPLAYRGTLSAALNDVITAAGERLADGLRFDARTNRANWEVEIKSVQYQNAVLRGTLSHRRKIPFVYEKFSTHKDILPRLGMSMKDSLRISLAAQQGGELASQSLPYLGEETKLVLTEFSGDLRGTLADLRGELHAEMRDIEIKGVHIPTFVVRGDVAGRTINFAMHDRDKSFSGELMVNFGKKTYPFAWEFNFADFDVQGLLGWEGGTQDHARLRANWKLRGEFARWYDAEGELAIGGFYVRRASREVGRDRFLVLEMKNPPRLLFNKGRWTFADNGRIELHGHGSSFYLRLSPNNGPRNLGVNFYGALDTRVLPLVFKEVVAANGYVQLKGGVEGKISAPLVDLTIEKLSPLSVSIAGLRPAFNDIDINAHYRDGAIVIDNLTGKKGDGSLAVRGRIYTTKTGQQNALQIELQNTHLIHPILGFKNTNLHISGDLALRWSELPINIGGNLTITKASNFSDFDVRKVIIASFEQKKYRGRMFERKAVANFNLAINAERALTIENRNMQALLSTQLQIQGSNTNPTVTGFVKIDKGKFIYRRNFILTRGMINFGGGQTIDPNLDIRAYSEVAPYVVNLAISGKASDPVGELTIDPPAREDGTLITKIDILTLLNRGKLPDPNKPIVDTSSAGFSEVTNVLVGQFEQPIEEILRRSGQNVVSRIFINTYASEKGVLYPKLTAPINLPWRDWDLSLQVDPYTWRLLTEYPVHDSITLSGSISGRSQDETEITTQDSANDQAVDLKFRFSIP